MCYLYKRYKRKEIRSDRRLKKQLQKLEEFWQYLRDYWDKGKAAVTILLIFVYSISHGTIAIEYEIENGWNGYKSFQNLLKEISAFIPVAGVFTAIHILEIDLIMLLSDWYKDLREKRDQKVKEEGIAEGKAAERQLWSAFWSAYQSEVKQEAEEITPDESASLPPKNPQ